MNTVELNKIRKSYDEFVAVDDLSLVIRPGEVYGLLGPKGAGKTSTLRMMIGITVPDSGAVSMESRGSAHGVEATIPTSVRLFGSYLF